MALYCEQQVGVFGEPGSGDLFRVVEPRPSPAAYSYLSIDPADARLYYAAVEIRDVGERAGVETRTADEVVGDMLSGRARYLIAKTFGDGRKEPVEKDDSLEVSEGYVVLGAARVSLQVPRGIQRFVQPPVVAVEGLEVPGGPLLPLGAQGETTEIARRSRVGMGLVYAAIAMMGDAAHRHGAIVRVDGRSHKNLTGDDTPDPRTAAFLEQIGVYVNPGEPAWGTPNAIAAGRAADVERITAFVLNNAA